MQTENVYTKLAEHLSCLGMGYPFREELVAILKENFSPQEAEVALAIPTKPVPLQPVEVDEILKGMDMPREKLVEILETLSRKGLLYSGRTDKGDEGFALQTIERGSARFLVVAGPRGFVAARPRIRIPRPLGVRFVQAGVRPLGVVTGGVRPLGVQHDRRRLPARSLR